MAGCGGIDVASPREVQVETIPLGHKVYIYLDGRAYEKRDDIDTIGILSPSNLAPTDCVLHSVKGTLSRRINLEIARAAYELGYRRLFVARASGKRVAREFDYIETRDGLDIYCADIERAVVGNG